MAIPPAFLEELKERTRLSEVVGRKVRLQSKGRGEHLGLCPFHNEKTPSFTVSDDKGFYYCFGCGASGSVIDFVMNTEGLAFPEAVEKLAAEVGMAVPTPDPETRRREARRATLVEVMELACQHFERLLKLPEGQAGRDYLTRRGLEAETLGRFRLGYAGSASGGLKAALAREGVDEALMLEAGLIRRPEDGRAPYDYFRDRVIFPITDRRGRVIAFGGRVLDDRQPKYLNSPDTPLFDKSRVLYGLAQAGEAIHQAGRVVVVEGYMDVIALARHGIREAVAPLGTALTESHLKALWSLAPEPILCFDGDAAGGRAASRAAERAVALLGPGRSLGFALLPAGRDPDDLLAAQGAPGMEAVLAAARPLADVLWDQLTAGQELTTPERRAALEARIETLVGRIDERTVARRYRDDFRGRAFALFRGGRGGRGGRDGIRAGGRDAGRAGGRDGYAAAGLPGVPGSGAALPVAGLHQRILLAAAIAHPGLFDHIGERLGLLLCDEVRLDSLRREVVKTLTAHPDLDAEGLKAHLCSLGYAREVSSLLGSAVFTHAAFARPEASPEAARSGWDHVHALSQQAALMADIHEAEVRLANEMSEEALSALTALKDMARRLTGSEDGDGLS
ncbi:DNA primase [Roseospirillum parvum]|uniref:DNA primase n=1 Tax=Roseospirillum parvum TaxID=83401 RepID=A0A1G7TZY6_9PROT|nr:DNA primase [Roseospirillum parvum]SDG40728.1 DNA primase [Roseospirillum parvum]